MYLILEQPDLSTSIMVLVVFACIMKKWGLIDFILKNLSINEGAYFYEKSKKAITKVAIAVVFQTVCQKSVDFWDAVQN